MERRRLTCLRKEIRLQRRRLGSARAFEPLVHVGEPGDLAVVVPALPAYDVGLRVELLSTCLELIDCARPCVWLTRSGPGHPTDLDMLWCGAAGIALPSHGHEAEFYVLTRAAWFSPLTDEARLWRNRRPPTRVSA